MPDNRRTIRHKGFQLTDADRPLLDRLSAEHRAALSHTPAQLASDLQWKEGTIKSRVHRARNALVALRGTQRVAADG